MPLPNLAGLSLNCMPCGAKFGKFEDALKLVTSGGSVTIEGRDSVSVVWLQGKEWLVDNATCAICLGALSKESILELFADGERFKNADGTREVEALFETSGKCGHVFHHTCLKLAIVKGLKICPICREPIDNEVLIRMGAPVVSEASEGGPEGLFAGEGANAALDNPVDGEGEGLGTEDGTQFEP